MKTEKKLTPLMQQYWEIKDKHQDKVLLFRMGDFFEIFYEDAIIAAPILNIALTSRNKKSSDDTPMCGFPHHGVATPIAKLLSAGHKVAICDQVEDPAQAKGLVKRAVTRILSPGMVYDPETLDQTSSNYLCSIDMSSVSFLESSTGEVFYYMGNSFEALLETLKVLNPVEVVLTRNLKNTLQEQLPKNLHLTTYAKSNDQLPDLFTELPDSMQLLLDYARYMQGESIFASLKPIERRQLESSMCLSSTLVRHLEVFQTYKGDKKGSLFSAINKTKTSAGARLLKQWLGFPLTDLDQIIDRQNQIKLWIKDPGKIKNFRKILSHLYDIERRLSKIAHASCSPKDLLSLCESLEAGLAATEFYDRELLKEDVFKNVIDIIQVIRQTIDLQAPVQFKKGGVIVRGFNPQLDEYIDLTENSKKLLVNMEQAEKEKNQIPSLKIKYNNVFGYFIEVTNTHKDKVPDHYKRKQTLTNAERYITEELHELEGKILSAQSKRVELELEFFSDVKKKIIINAQGLLSAAHYWSHWDVYSSLAWLALEQS